MALSSFPESAGLATVATTGQYSDLLGVPSLEPALGNPASDGYVLSSTAAGARSWVAQSGGGQPTMRGWGDYDAAKIRVSALDAYATANNAPGADQIEFTELVGLAGCVVVNLGVKITTAVASGAVQAALYTANSSGDLEIIAGTSVTLDASTTGTKWAASNFAGVTIPSGTVVAGFLFNSSTIAVEYSANGVAGNLRTLSAGTVVLGRRGARTYSLGLPATYASSAMINYRGSAKVRALLKEA